MNAEGNRAIPDESVTDEIESASELPAGVQSSGVRKTGHEDDENPDHDADYDEETVLARLLFGWDTAATACGLIVGGLFFDPVGAVVGAVVGSVAGVLSVLVVVAVRGRRSPEDVDPDNGG